MDMKKTLFLMILFVNLPLAYADSVDKIIFVEPTGDGLDQLVIAEMIKQKIRCAVTGDKKQADYILNLGYSDRSPSNQEVVDVIVLSRGQPVVSSHQTAASLVRVKDQRIIWAQRVEDLSVRLPT